MILSSIIYMSGFKQRYSKFVRSYYDRSARPVWPPTAPGIRLGDYGPVNDGVFEQHGNLLESLGIEFSIVEDEHPSVLTMITGREASLEVKLAGQIAPSMPGVPQANAGLKLKFGRAGAFILASQTCRTPRIKNLGEIESALLEALQSEQWDKEWRLVTSLLHLESGRFFLSKASNSALDISLGVPAAAIGVPDLGNTEVEAEIVGGQSEEAILSHNPAENFTPIVLLHRLKSSLLGDPDLGPADVSQDDESGTLLEKDEEGEEADETQASSPFTWETESSAFQDEKYLVLKLGRETRDESFGSSGRYEDTPPTAGSYESLGGSRGHGFENVSAERFEGSPKEAGDLLNDPSVHQVIPEFPLSEPATPSSGGEADDGRESGAGVTWGVHYVGADGDHDWTGRGTRVAVLDTGIYRDHRAFSDRPDDFFVVKNFTQEGRGPDDVSDRNGHGTHCAGTIFGSEVDGLRIGVAPGIEKAIIGKVLGAGASTLTLYEAISWAKDNGADIISMSLRFDFVGARKRYIVKGAPGHVATSMAIYRFVQNMRLFDSLGVTLGLVGDLPGQKPTLLLGASGNESSRISGSDHVVHCAPPAVANSIIAVGAHDKNGVVASFSNSDVAIVAPGVDVRSAGISDPSEIVSEDGTSQATPHVAGVAALWLEALKAHGASVSLPFWKAKLAKPSAPPKIGPDYGLGEAVSPVRNPFHGGS